MGTLFDTDLSKQNALNKHGDPRTTEPEMLSIFDSVSKLSFPYYCNEEIT